MRNTTEIMLREEMELYQDEDWSQPELEDSTYNPANDEFKRTVVAVQRRIYALTKTMPPRHAMIIKMVMSNVSNIDIAQKVRVHPSTVGKVRNSDEGKQLANAIIQLNSLMGGVSALEREQLLWRIAIKNEDISPKTSVAAISAINGMKVDHDAAKQKIKDNQELTQRPSIVINLTDTRLVPTKLDV